MQGSYHPDYASVARLFESQLPREGPGGAALTVMHRGEVVVDLAGGTRDDAGTPFTSDTLALSFSTTKGVASTLLHVLAAQGRVDYDAPIARYWPEFAQGGKGAITVRQLLCHEAGLHSIRAVTDGAVDLLDWDGMLRRLELAVPLLPPGTANAYHGITYGYLVGGLIERITGRRFADVLHDELASKLDLSGCYVGLPDDAMPRRAKLVGATSARPRGGANERPRVEAPRSERPSRGALAKGGIAERLSRLAGVDPSFLADALLARGMSRFDWNDEAVVKATIPAAGGMFDARSLARVYGVIANDGELDGVRLFSPGDIARFSEVQNTRLDRVLPMPMRWRLGYHRVLNVGSFMPDAFGHFGFGGSGAYCDPSRRISVGYVLNHGVGTPFGDSRIWSLAGAIGRATDAKRVRRFFARR